MHPDEARGILADLIGRGALWIIQQLGYTPVNKAGDTFVGDVGVGNVTPVSRFMASGGGVSASLADLNSAVAGVRANTIFQLANPAIRLAIAYLAADHPMVQSVDTTNTARMLAVNPFGGAVGIGLAPSGTYALEVGGNLSINSAVMIRTATNFTNGSAAAVGTLGNAPAAGNPTKWIPINDNGVTRYIPAW